MKAHGPGSSLARQAMRADARRNYDRIITTADATVAELGAEASMEEIARRVGLGSTTLHRHFPTRQALLEAVFHDRVQAICAQAYELLDDPEPDVALVTWLRAFVGHAVTQRGLAAVMGGPENSEGPESAANCRTLIRSAAGQLLARSQRAGSTRSDIAVSDVLKLLTAIALVVEQEPDGVRQADQLLAIVVDGIRQPASDAH